MPPDNNNNSAVRSLGAWLRVQAVEFVDRAFQYVLWIGGLAVVSFGGAIASALAHAFRSQWIVVGVASGVAAGSILTVVFALYHRWRVEERRASEVAWTELENERDALETTVAILEERLERETTGSEEARATVATMLNELQLEIADGKVDIAEFIPLSILEPMRDILLRGRRDVRISVLQPRRDDPEVWRMRWAVGHLRSVRGNFARRIDDTVAGIAYRNGRAFMTVNIHADERVPSPKLRRSFTSQMVIPIRVGRQRAGALSIVSYEEAAFSESDLTFGEVVAAMIGLALAVEQRHSVPSRMITA